MIHAELGAWRRHLRGEPWETVLAFLENEAAAAPLDTRIALGDAGVYALVMRYDTRDCADAVLEAHDAHVDVQASLEGSEYIDWFARSTLTVSTPYDAERDAVFFSRPCGMPLRLNNVPGRFTVLFPEDAHMAQLRGADAPAPVKKVVVKVPVALLPGGEARP